MTKENEQCKGISKTYPKYLYAFEYDEIDNCIDVHNVNKTT